MQALEQQIKEIIQNDTKEIERNQPTPQAQAVHYWNRSLAYRDLAKIYFQDIKYNEAITLMYAALSDARDAQMRYSSEEDKAHCEKLIEGFIDFKSDIVESKKAVQKNQDIAIQPTNYISIFSKKFSLSALEESFHANKRPQ